MEIWKSADGSEIAILAATWELNPKITLASLSDEFKTNPTKALKNYASIVAFSVENAIKDKDIILRHSNTQRGHPWDQTRGLGIGDIKTGKFYEWFRGKPGRRYFIHIDIGIRRDCAGIAMAHREPDGVTCIDFMTQIPVPFGRDISIAGLREWVYALSLQGFHIQQVSYDGFQSEESRQVLEEKGYVTQYVSVDKTTDPYDTLIEQMLTPGRLDYYNYPVFIMEMEELKLVNGTKYDHPKKTRLGRLGSKDVADAVAGAVWSSVQYAREHKPEAPSTLRVIRRDKKFYRSDYGERGMFG